jgi:hypothetical protein
MSLVIAGLCPLAIGQIGVTQRAIFPVSFVGVVKALAKAPSISGVAVTVTDSCGDAGGDCADAVRTGTISTMDSDKILNTFIRISCRPLLDALERSLFPDRGRRSDRTLRSGFPQRGFYPFHMHVGGSPPVACL